MKAILKPFFVVFIFFLFSNTLFGGAVISRFEGKDGGNKVILLWKSIVELNLDRFEIERSLDEKQFIKIGKVTATGPKNYEFVDKSVFKQNSRTFYYRLKLIDKDGTSTVYGKIITVKPNISGIQHTWGSLKAMFR